MSSTLRIALATFRRRRRDGIRLSPRQFASVMRKVRDVEQERKRAPAAAGGRNLGR